MLTVRDTLLALMFPLYDADRIASLVHSPECWTVPILNANREGGKYCHVPGEIHGNF
jgi:hypothetical protein